MTKKYKLLKDTPHSLVGAVYEEGLSCDEYFHVHNGVPYGSHHYSSLLVENSPEWFELIKDEPQFKILSPAVCCSERLVKTQGIRFGKWITTDLFESEQDAKHRYAEDFYSWPAINTQGGPVQYRIPTRKS